ASDPYDPHVGTEFAFHLGMPVRVVGASMSLIEDALHVVAPGDAKSPGSRPRRSTPAFPHGAPQSSVPPPPSEDIPIPLVRRSMFADEDTADMDTLRLPRTEGAEEEPVLALRPRTRRSREPELDGANGQGFAGIASAQPGTDPEPDTVDAATLRKG